MKITRRKFLGIVGLGVLGLILGRFLNLFKGNTGATTARYWRSGDKLAG